MNKFEGKYYPEGAEECETTERACCSCICPRDDGHETVDCPRCGLSHTDTNDDPTNPERFERYKEFMNSSEQQPTQDPPERGIVTTTKNFTAVKDSGKREEFDTGSRRDSREGKGRYDLIPPYSLKRLAVHYENGAVKYGDANWQKGQPLGRYLDSAMRHMQNTLNGDTDEDHPAAAAWNMFAFMWTANEIEEGRLPAELDDKNLTSKGVTK